MSSNKFYYGVPLLMAIMGCESVYKNPEYSNTLAIFKVPNSLKQEAEKSTISQGWYIYSKHNCADETGYGRAAGWIISRNKKEQIGTARLEPDKRIYLKAHISQFLGMEFRNCLNLISFTPEKNKQYIIQQHLFIDINRGNQTHCVASIIDKNNNIQPGSLLQHPIQNCY